MAEQKARVKFLMSLTRTLTQQELEELAENLSDIDSDEYEGDNDLEENTNSYSEDEESSDNENDDFILDDDNGEGEMQETVAADDIWTEYQNDDPDFPELQFTVQNPGIQIQDNIAEDNASDFFYRFFTHDLLSAIINETNAYAKKKIESLTPLPKYSIWQTWQEVSLEEMKAFLGVMYNLSYKHPIKQ